MRIHVVIVWTPDAVELDPLGDETDNPILDNDTCPVGSDPSTDYEK